MGLLDNRDDVTSGLLTAGLAMLAARGVNPLQALGQGGLVGLQAMANSAANRRKAEEDEIQRKLARMQLEQGGLTLKQARQQMEDEEKARKIESEFASAPPLPSMAPTLENAQALAKQPSRFQLYTQLADRLRAGGLRDAARKADEYAAKFKPKVHSTKTMTDQRTGERITVNVYEDGTSETLPYGPDKEKLHFGSTGGMTEIPIDPFTGKPVGPGLPATMTPYEDQKIGIDREQLGVSRGNLAVAQGNAGLARERFNWEKQKLPDYAAKEVSGIDAQMTVVERAMSDVKKHPDAFGLQRGLATLAGAVPESLAGRLDTPEQRETRAFVYNVVSKVINERAGAAQSKQELARLRSFLPAETDDDKQVLDKLSAFREYLSEIRSSYVGGPRQATGAAAFGPREKGGAIVSGGVRSMSDADLLRGLGLGGR